MTPGERLAKQIMDTQALQPGNCSGASAGQSCTIRLPGNRRMKARAAETLPPGPVLFAMTPRGAIAVSANKSRQVGERIVDERIRKQPRVLPLPLPFHVVLGIDSSGSLRPADVPEVYDAIDLIKLDLVAIGNFVDQQQADQFIVDTRINERYLDGFTSFPEQLAPIGSTRCVIVFFQDEVNDTYGADFSDGSTLGDLDSRFFEDYDAFKAKYASLEDDFVSLLGARIFVPQNSQNSLASGFIEHLELVVDDGTGLSQGAISANLNEFEQPIVTYEELIDRTAFTVEYVYDKIAEYLNTFFVLLGSSVLPTYENRENLQP